jgi:hypothetical protein
MFFGIILTMVLTIAIGCSDDDKVVGPGNNDTNDQSVTIDASSYDDYAFFSLTTGTTVAADGDWHMGFRREATKLNGGLSAVNGDVEGADLGVVDYDAVTIDDTAGVTWAADAIDYFIDEWYTYNPQTHVSTITQYVYSMLDAGGDNYLKFQVDSMVGGGQPPDMGTVYLKYFYQSTAGSSDLSGATVEASINVGATTGYFDFSSGSQVTPATPESSTDWDIAFYAYDLMQNSGPNGSGDCAAFLAWGELADPTDIDGFTAQPAVAPMFADIPLSTMTEWYTYDGATHRLTSDLNVYLVKVDANTIYKVRIDSYYVSIGGTSAAANYTVTYDEL